MGRIVDIVISILKLLSFISVYEFFDLFLTATNILLLIIFAIFGYSEWRRRFISSKDFELATRLLGIVNSLQFEISLLRTPFRSPLLAAKRMRDFPKDHEYWELFIWVDLTLDATEKRWEKLIRLLTEFENIKSEAEEILNIDISTPYFIISEKFGDLYSSLMTLSEYYLKFKNEEPIENNEILDIVDNLKITINNFSFEGNQPTSSSDDDDHAIVIKNCTNQIIIDLAQFFELKN